MHLMATLRPFFVHCAFSTSENVPSPFFPITRYSTKMAMKWKLQMQVQEMRVWLMDGKAWTMVTVLYGKNEDIIGQQVSVLTMEGVSLQVGLDWCHCLMMKTNKEDGADEGQTTDRKKNWTAWWLYSSSCH